MKTIILNPFYAMLHSFHLQHTTPIPSHDTTRGLIQLNSNLKKWFREVTLLHSTSYKRIFPIPNELRTSMSLSGTSSIGFPLHKGAPSLLHSPSVNSPYPCQFLFIKYQVATLYFFSLDMGLLYSRVTINILVRFPNFLRENSLASLFLKLV
jgi:hypothetical protein